MDVCSTVCERLSSMELYGTQDLKVSELPSPFVDLGVHKSNNQFWSTSVKISLGWLISNFVIKETGVLKFCPDDGE